MGLRKAIAFMEERQATLSSEQEVQAKRLLAPYYQPNYEKRAAWCVSVLQATTCRYPIRHSLHEHIASHDITLSHLFENWLLSATYKISPPPYFKVLRDWTHTQPWWKEHGYVGVLSSSQMASLARNYKTTTAVTKMQEPYKWRVFSFPKPGSRIAALTNFTPDMGRMLSKKVSTYIQSITSDSLAAKASIVSYGNIYKITQTHKDDAKESIEKVKTKLLRIS